MARVLHLSTLLEEQFPDGPIQCMVDATTPAFRMKCFEDSRDLFPVLKEKVQSGLFLNVYTTNSISDIPWGRIGYDRMPAIPASSGYIDGKSLIIMATSIVF